MKKPETPVDEDSRLKTLNGLGILDTPFEDRFDRLTRMAKRIFEVPISMVSLVDAERQWFKSCLGLDATETSRKISFCGHAIMGEEILVIEDTRLDDRFHDNPLVTEHPLIRFYAGRPIKALNGSKIGTICIIDQKPRQFSAEDIQALDDLASMVENEIAAIELALLDDLTGIANRRGFIANANQIISICKRQAVPASLVYFDLDNFKQINDSFGHAKGDAVLITFASQLEILLRDSDLFARIGGDEFVALLMNTSKSMAEEFIGRFIKTLEEYNQVDRGYKITFSHGVVGFDAEKHQNIEPWLAECDASMYTKKHANQSIKGT